MTKSEAIKSMKQGNKITHLLFSKDEFITMDNDYVIDENGYKLDYNEFWTYRTHSNFDSGYFIKK